MRVLFIANRFPYPPYRGDKLKIYNLTKRLSKDHELYLVTFYEKRSELDDLEHLRPFFKHIELVYLPKWRSILNCIPALFSSKPLQLAYFSHPRMHRNIAYMLKTYEIDVIHTQHLRMSQYSRHLELPRILDLPDAFSLYWKRRRDTDRPWYLRMIDRVEIRRLVRYEAVIKEFDCCLVCSSEDKAYLEKVHQSDNIRVSLNGVDLDTFDIGDGHDYGPAETLLFTGNMDYAPNVDAVQHFVKNIWPGIHRQFPRSRFVIAGQRPVPAVRQLASESVEVTGFIPRLQDMYADASILVAPLRFGAGTQNKVLEAMAMGVPVVCTKIGFAGLEVQSGEGALLAKTDEEFSQHVTELLKSREYRQDVGSKGLAVARSRFSWDVVARGLESYLKNIL